MTYFAKSPEFSVSFWDAVKTIEKYIESGKITDSSLKDALLISIDALRDTYEDGSAGGYDTPRNCSFCKYNVGGVCRKSGEKIDSEYTGFLGEGHPDTCKPYYLGNNNRLLKKELFNASCVFTYGSKASSCCSYASNSVHIYGFIDFSRVLVSLVKDNPDAAFNCVLVVNYLIDTYQEYEYYPYAWNILKACSVNGGNKVNCLIKLVLSDKSDRFDEDFLENEVKSSDVYNNYIQNADFHGFPVKRWVEVISDGCFDMYRGFGL